MDFRFSYGLTLNNDGGWSWYWAFNVFRISGDLAQRGADLILHSMVRCESPYHNGECCANLNVPAMLVLVVYSL